MRRPFTRIAVIVMLAVGLAAATTVPASANTSGSMAVQGAVVVGNGISFSCFDNGTVSPAACPVIGTTGSATATFGGTGVGVIKTANKAKCGAPPACVAVEAGQWAITANGSVAGTCDLATGSMSGTMAPSLPLGTKIKSRTFSLTFTIAAGHIVATGSTGKGETLVGSGRATPSPGQATCTDRSGKVFIIVIQLEIVR